MVCNTVVNFDPCLILVITYYKCDCIYVFAVVSWWFCCCLVLEVLVLISCVLHFTIRGGWVCLVAHEFLTGSLWLVSFAWCRWDS